MLFLINVDHGSFEKAKKTRQINLQAATVSLQVVISLCKRKETAALKLNRPLSSRQVKKEKLRHEGLVPVSKGSQAL